MQSLKSLLTAEEAAEVLAEAGYAVSAETVRRWGRAGQVPMVRMPGGLRARKLFRREDIAALLETDTEAGVA